MNKWSFGAFAFGAIYYFANGLIKEGFLTMFIPFYNIYLYFKGIFRGRRMSWGKGGWQDFESYQKRQKLLDKIGWIFMFVWVALLAIIISSVVWGIRAPKLTGHNFINKLSTNQVPAAYIETSKDFQKNTSLEELKAYVAGVAQFKDMQDVTFDNVSVENSTAKTQGTITGSGGKVPIEMGLSKEDGVWKVDYMDINPESNGVQSENNSNETTIQFPTARYKDFAIATNSDMLDPAIAYPNLKEYGSPHLEIVKNENGYSKVNLPLHGIGLNIPLGWSSKGGFDTMERIEFFPATSKDDLINSIANGSSVGLGIKVLDASGLGVSDFNSIMTKIKEMYSEGQSVVIESDEPNHMFVAKTEDINNSELATSSSVWSIYIQDPNPKSTVWVKISMRSPKIEFLKYKGLLGLEYKDILIDWAGLDEYMKSKP